MTTTTYQIDLPPLPTHIAEKWKVKRVGSLQIGDIYLGFGGISTYQSDCDSPPFDLHIILERIAPPLTPPEWLVRSDYDAVKYEPGGWMLCRSGLPSIPANIHHDLRDMLANIDPKATPVAWERGQ